MKDRLAPIIPSNLRIWLGILLIVPYLVIQNLWFKAAFLLVLLILLYLSGKKFRPLPNFLLFSSILFFQLLSPSGEVLWQAGVFMVTREALEKGLMRGMTLVGLIFISLISVRPGVGKKKETLLARTFYYFSCFMESRDFLIKGEKKDFFHRLDTLLLDVYRSRENEGNNDN